MTTTLRRSPEQDVLNRALLVLSSRGERPRYGDPVTHEMWLSEDEDERAAAASWCEGCQVFAECSNAAEAAGEKFGVWAGVDRTRKATR